MPRKIPLHQNAFFVGLYFVGGQNDYPQNFPSMKTPENLETFIPANSKSTTTPDILLQKLTELKLEGIKST